MDLTTEINYEIDNSENNSENNSTDTLSHNNMYECIESLVVDNLENIDNINIHDYKFDEKLKNEIYKNFIILFENYDYDKFNEFYDETIEDIFINNGLIKRSYKLTESLKYFNNIIQSNENIINYLKNVKQPEQKTKEWYDFRYNHITGSNAWKIFGNPSTQNQLYYEKLNLNTNGSYGYSNMNDNPLNWGHKYEPLTIKFYEYYNDVIVSEFGCIPHKNIPFLAASPDGIVTSEKLNGRMVEIKNVVSREITQIPKMEYYIQMQLQMEVCDLNECDFIETKFTEYESYYDFKQDESNENKGMIIVIMEIGETSRYIYEYADLFKNNENQLDNYSEEIYKKYNLNKETLANNDETYKWVKNIYWKLDVYSNVLVQRNMKWFEEIYPKLKDFWNNVLEERKIENSYLKYKPKSRNKDKQNLNKPINLISIEENTQEPNKVTIVNDECTNIDSYKDNKVIDLNSFV